MKRVLLLLALATAAHADFRDSVDYTKLKTEYGAALPSVASVRLIQVEYIRSNSWAPGPVGGVADKTFNYNIGRSIAPVGNNFSQHALEVAAYLAGKTTSMTPELTSWQSSEAVAFTYPGNLNAGRALMPIPAAWDVENHSWGGNDSLWCVQILEREDYRIERDNIVACVGVDNASTMSNMMANGYNSIAVGVSSGNHARGGTNIIAVGRAKPDLVAPADYTSYATPIVASASMILIAETARTPALAPARNPMVIKALLVAGATQNQFPSWSHSPAHPLDNVYGAGQLNVYNTYKTLVAGQQAQGSVPAAGWDFGAASQKIRNLYFFTVPDGKSLVLSAALAWYRHVTPDAVFANWVPWMANLDLKLWQSTGNAPSTLIDVSSSTIDNVEYILHTLPAGQYAMEVTTDTEGEKYGLAWTGALTSTAADSPTPIIVPTAPTPTPVPIAQAPRVTKFTASAGWSPAVLSWDGTGVRAVLTDSNGVQMPEPPSGSIMIDATSDKLNPYSYKNDWYLTEVAVDGTSSTFAHLTLNGKFNAAQVASVATPPVQPTPVPVVPTPTPTPDTLRAAAAKSVGATYDPVAKTYTVSANQLTALTTALQGVP